MLLAALGLLLVSATPAFAQDPTPLADPVLVEEEPPVSADAMTAAGPYRVRDIWPGPIGSSIGDSVDVNGIAYFAADDGVNGMELWKSDGTAAGTVMVKDIWPGANPSIPANLSKVGTRLFFAASLAPHISCQQNNSISPCTASSPLTLCPCLKVETLMKDS